MLDAEDKEAERALRKESNRRHYLATRDVLLPRRRKKYAEDEAHRQNKVLSSRAYRERMRREKGAENGEGEEERE